MSGKTKQTLQAPPPASTALVPLAAPDMTALAPLVNESASAFLGEAKGAQEAPKKLPLIGVLHKYAKFELPSGEVADAIDGYLIYYFNTRKYYKAPPRPGEKGKAPDCWSGDCLKPHPSSADPQAEFCASCPQNEFGTARDGRSKACSTPTWLFLVNPAFGPVPVGILVVPSSSLRPLFGTRFESGYLAQAKARHGAYQIVWTRFRLKLEGGDGVPFSVLQCEMGPCAGREQAQALGRLHNKFRDAFESYRGNAGDAEAQPDKGNDGQGEG